jgi:hypothetical protein
MAKVETIVFVSLVLDLFAFTIPLPLFPRLIEWYTLVSLTPEKPTMMTHFSIKEGSIRSFGFLVEDFEFRVGCARFHLQTN